MSEPSLAGDSNGGRIATKEIPRLVPEVFRSTVIDSVKSGSRVVAFFGTPGPGDGILLTVLLARPKSQRLDLAVTDVRAEVDSITPDCPQVQLFEREIAEQFGIRPVGHPWLKPVRFHHPFDEREDVLSRGSGSELIPAVTSFFRVEGEEVHEVAVGPVHAGIIEPGHFRFQCHGEKVFHLEIALGFQHRGVERALIGGPNKRTIHLMETAAGDTTIGHATAYAQIVETLSGSAPSPRALAIRAIAIELERLANHVGDLGALANDIGYLPPASYFGRLRGDFLNLTASLCGNRFGRGLVRPGGVRHEVEPERVRSILNRLDDAMKDVQSAGQPMWKSHLVTDRFNGTGVISRETALDLGLVGVAARACGIERDVRREFPIDPSAWKETTASTWPTGDIFARAHVRWLEILESAEFVRTQLNRLPEGSLESTVGPLKPNAVAVSLVEGWRGEICHVASTDERGRFSRYKMVDPSFHNWTGLAMALRGMQISDFPLCNKSFNLSYCGHDL
ncbi:MAG: NADH-quinone oxidoreductase subunit C [Nitrospirae bacterium]|nr:NADH-quinone oxidoreductase subunit C [Nitrospirota bacterium]